MQETIAKRFAEAAETIGTAADQLAEPIARAAEMIIRTCRADRPVLLFGNGGSAADAQHIAGELVGRFLTERRALRVQALTTDTSVLTCLGNDYDFDMIFARQVEAAGAPGGAAIALSTSGNSANVVAGLAKARELDMKTIAFTGLGGGKCAPLADVLIAAPSDHTPHVQEVHQVAYHVLSELVEKAIAADS